MDSADPEKRISELERQLAQRDNSEAHQYRITPDWVHNVAFSQSPRGTRGYNEDEVDELLDRVEGALRNPTARGAITAADVNGVVFSKPPMGKRGYHENDVDAFLDLVKIELSRRSPRPGIQPELTDPSKPVAQPARIHQRLQLARGLIHVNDADGVQWKVYRRWFPNWSLSWLHGADPGDLGAYLFAVLWPPWFIAKCLGVKWIIAIERSGREIGDVRVRGWCRSQRRIRELAESAAAGTLFSELRA